MRKHFVTGLILLLPLALTIIILLLMINLLTRPFIGIVSEVMKHLGIFQNAEQIQLILGQFFILVVIFFFIVLLGMFTRWIFAHYVIHFGERLVNRIPIVRSIYKTFQDVTNTVFSSKNNAFKQVVMVPYPHKNSYALGFITRENITTFHPSEELVAVFVPTTPNPTSGFLMMYPSSDIVRLEMSVEDAFKCILSCGVVVT